MSDSTQNHIPPHLRALDTEMQKHTELLKEVNSAKVRLLAAQKLYVEAKSHRDLCEKEFEVAARKLLGVTVTIVE